MFTQLRKSKKNQCLNDSDCRKRECGKCGKKNRFFAASAAFALCAVMTVFCASFGNGTLAQTVGKDSVTNHFDILIGKYFTITYQYYLWDDHDNCVRFYTDKTVTVKAKGKDEDGNAYAIYQFPTDLTNEIYLQEGDDTYYKFASFWGPDDENATVDKTDGNIIGRRWERIWNPDLDKPINGDDITNLSADSKITIKGDMIYEVNYYPVKYDINYVLGWEEDEGWQLGDPVTSVHGSNALNPGDYTVIYKEEIEEPTRLGYTFLGWSKNDEAAAPQKELSINSAAGSDIGKATGDHVENDTFYYIPYLDDKYKGDNGEHLIGKLTPDNGKITALYNELKANEKGDVTLYAQWMLNPYNITYTLNGGSLVGHDGNPLPYTYDETSNTFADDSGSTVDVSGAPTMYNVELGDENGNPLPNVTGGSVEERKLTIDVEAIPPADSNSTFAGWKYYDAQGLSQVSTPIVISHGTVGDFHLEAVFVSSQKGSNSIIYENVPQEWLEGTDALPESYATSGAATVIPVKSTVREVRTGTDKEGNPIIKTYAFTGWTCSNEYSVAPVRVNGDLTVPTDTQGDIILVAHWQETTEDAYCTVNYYAQKKPHIGFIPEYKVKAGETITLVKNQYTLDETAYPDTKFAGWYMYTTVGEHQATYQPGDAVTITEDTAFHALWETKVTFEPYENETPETMYLEYGKPLSDYADILPAFTMTGYKQIGWNTTKAGAIAGETVNLSEISVEAGMRLYAVWQEWKIPVTFSNGTHDAEKSLNVESTTEGAKVTLPEFSETGLTAQDGHLFGGWLDESKSKVYQPGEKLAVSDAANLTLTAYWINRTQTVTVQDGNSTIPDTAITIELSEDGTYTFTINDLHKAAGFDARSSFVVYIGNSYGSSLQIGIVDTTTTAVAFSMKETYTLGDLEIKLTDDGVYLFIKSWW